jgi:outer membrane beta-barrel protein
MLLRAKAFRTVALLGAVVSSSAQAQEALEKVVVRNRLFDMSGRFELGATVGFQLITELTQHTNITLNAAYNVTDTFAIEARVGYAISGHTGLADEISNGPQGILAYPAQASNPNWPNVVDDLSNLWEMKFNAEVGLRWAPIYGKISLLGELPVHFQAYLWLGAGAGYFQRTSVVQCLHIPDQERCDNQADIDAGTATSYQSWWETESQVKWIGSAAFGLRFFLFGNHSVKLELRDYLWPDSYLTQIDRSVAQTGTVNGTPANNPGVTSLLTLEVGYSYAF